MSIEEGIGKDWDSWTIERHGYVRLVNGVNPYYDLINKQIKLENKKCACPKCKEKTYGRCE